MKSKPDQNNYETPAAIMTSSEASKNHAPPGDIQGKSQTFRSQYQTPNAVIARSETSANRGPQCTVNPKSEQHCYETVRKVIASTPPQAEQKEDGIIANPLYSYLSDACSKNVET